MQIFLLSAAHQMRLSLGVAKIEVEAISRPSDGGIDFTYFRTIRFTTVDGEVLDVFCEATAKEDLKLLDVRVLRPVKKPKPRNWLEPQKKPIKESSEK
jgi:hypothetical protein